MTKKYPPGKHPNSLKSLVPIGTKGLDANELREKGLEVRKRNSEERAKMKNAVRAFQDLKIEIPDSETVLKIAMSKAIAENDMDEATRIAALLMPYEKPKLASQDISVTSDVSDKTDAELAALLEEFAKSDEDGSESVH